MNPTKPKKQPTSQPVVSVVTTACLKIARIAVLAHECYDFRETVWHKQLARSVQSLVHPVRHSMQHIELCLLQLSFVITFARQDATFEILSAPL